MIRPTSRPMTVPFTASMKPMFDLRNYPGAKLQDDAPAMKGVFWDADEDDIVRDEKGQTILLPPILVPCYYSHNGSNGDERSLVEHALSKECRLFPCTPSKADRAYVFTRGYVKAEKIKSAIKDLMGITEDHINVYRKLGNGFGEDILILLRNPYGGKAGEQNEKKNGEDLTFESRVYDLIESAVSYIDENEPNIINFEGYSDLTKKCLKNYFYGSGGLREELKKACQRIEEGKKPIFIKQIKIFAESQASSAAVTPDPTKREIKQIDKIEFEKLFEKEFEAMLARPEINQKIKEIAES